MLNYVRYLKSDLYKLYHSSFFVIHLLIPAAGVAMLLLFAVISNSDTPAKLAAFCQFIAIAFPFIISMVCFMLAEQEAKAGHFQNILCLPGRKAVILSKLTILLASGLISVLLTSVSFSVLFPLVSEAAEIPIGFYTLIPLVLWGSHLFLYCFHLLIAFRFGKNVGIGLGGLGSLLAALLYTGLGSGLWFVVPYGWGIHFSMYTLQSLLGVIPSDLAEFRLGFVFSALFTCAIIVTLPVWFSRYNGNRASD